MSNATIVVQFGNPDGSGAEGHLSAEIDGRPTGLNAGKTSFAPGDSVAILVFKTGNVRITATGCSAGSISARGTVTVTRTEDVTFADSKTGSLSVPSTGSLSVKWLGRSLGGLFRGADAMSITAGGKGIAVARITYQATAHVYTLYSPSSVAGETDYSIAVVIAGEAT